MSTTALNVPVTQSPVPRHKRLLLLRPVVSDSGLCDNGHGFQYLAPGGVIKGSSHRCTATSSLTPIWSRLLLTVPFAGLIRVRLEP